MTTRSKRGPAAGTRNLLSAADAAELLREAVARVRALAPSSLAIFDLDSTLLDNSPRQAQIMREYGAKHSVAELAHTTTEHWTGWDAAAAMANAGLSKEGIDRHYQPFRRYWFERFFTSEYCAVDSAVPGAVRYVRAMQRAGGMVLYVTGRHEPMREGTLSSFRRLGFPEPDQDRVHLLMKPTLDEHDDAYKERMLALVDKMGAVVAAFDNEPTHINSYRAAFPEALTIHLSTDHSPRGVMVAAGIPSVADFSPFAD